MISGEVSLSVQRRNNQNLADDQRRDNSVCVKKKENLADDQRRGNSVRLMNKLKILPVISGDVILSE